MIKNVLIADDAGFVRELLINACEQLGYQVIGEAADGLQAIEMAKNLKPDIIFMDLVMPKINGLEATVKILEILPEVFIIGCSSLDDEFTLKQVNDKGCRAFLRKPFNLNQIKIIFDQMQMIKKEIKHA